MSKPILATTVSDLPQVLQGCAELVQPGDAAALKTALRYIVKHPEKARVWGERARARCLEEFSMSRVAEKLLALIKGLAPRGS